MTIDEIMILIVCGVVMFILARGFDKLYGIAKRLEQQNNTYKQENEMLRDENIKLQRSAENVKATFREIS